MPDIALAQLNPTIGDLDGNLALMRAAAHRAAGLGADMVVFPELCLTGYYPGDWLDDAAFMARVDQATVALRAATRATPGLVWVVGMPLRRNGPGKPLANGLQVLRDGGLLASYAKQLLPTYDVFDERRHFEPGPDAACVVEVDGVAVGFLICEDGWNDAGTDYAVNPLARLAANRCQLVVSVNASPSSWGKRAQRHALFAAACRRYALPLVYVNQVGGHDQLVYDGASFAMNAQGEVVAECASFAEDLLVVRLERNALSSTPAPQTPAVGRALPRPEFYRRQIVLGLRDYARRCGFARAVVGSSGGIDSALTLALAAEALGPHNVTAVTMPSRFSSAGSVEDSKTLCAALGVTLHTHPVRALVKQYEGQFRRTFGAPLRGIALENVQARIRGTVLMEYSNTFDALLLTTGNKSELSVGYCTLYGDTNGGLGLIGDLYKTEVFELAWHINAAAGREVIPAAVLEKAPSAELAPGQTDQDTLPPYPLLDAALKLLIEGTCLSSFEAAACQAELERLPRAECDALLRRVRQMVVRSEYKRRQAPPVIRVRARAFGPGRQVPIAARPFE